MSGNNKVKNSKYRAKNLAISLIILVSILSVIELLYSQILINTSNSHEGTIFWKTDEKPAKDDFVYFEFQHKLLPKDIQTLSKKLICIKGDNLTVSGQFIVCNGQQYPIKRNIKTSSGKLIEQFYYDGIVPDGKAIIWGSNLESFDSRYWGFIDYNKLNQINLVF